MSSVQGEKKCPKCGGAMFYEFNCRTTEEVRNCCRCGFHQNWFLLRNEDGSVREKEEGTWIGEYDEKLGYGSACIRFKDGCGYMYTFTDPLTEADKDQLTEIFQQQNVDDTSYAALYDPENNAFTVLFGTLPGAYEEYEDGE